MQLKDSTTNNRKCKLHLGANVVDSGTFFRVWAPKCHQIDVVIEGKNDLVFPLEKKLPRSSENHLAAGIIGTFLVPSSASLNCARV